MRELLGSLEKNASDWANGTITDDDALLGGLSRYEEQDTGAGGSNGHRPDNVVVVAVLIALIVLLCIILGVVSIPPIIRYFRRRMPVSPKRIERRYTTIDGWLITKKIQAHDAACEHVLKYRTTTVTMDMVDPQICHPVHSHPQEHENENDIETGEEKSPTTNEEEETVGDPEEIMLAPHRSNLSQIGLEVGNDDDVSRQSSSSSSGSECDIIFAPRGCINSASHHHRVNRDAVFRSMTLEDDSSPSSSSPLESESKEDVATPETPIDDEEGGNDNDDDDNDVLSRGATSHDHPDKECPICMEEFQVGEKVSWSASKDCGHAFHHACIREWLLRRAGCPYCRETFLPVDRYRGRALTKEEIKELSRERAIRLMSTYYCVQEGLVDLDLSLCKGDYDASKKTRFGLEGDVRKKKKKTPAGITSRLWASMFGSASAGSTRRRGNSQGHSSSRHPPGLVTTSTSIQNNTSVEEEHTPGPSSSSPSSSVIPASSEQILPDASEDPPAIAMNLTFLTDDSSDEGESNAQQQQLVFQPSDENPVDSSIRMDVTRLQV